MKKIAITGYRWAKGESMPQIFLKKALVDIQFMALGLPREPAIKLAGKFSPTSLEESEFNINWLKKIDINTIEMPSYLRKQIKNIQKVF
ncbi:hypothetical protein [Neobacillus vireti]|uniref:hypothetical protein n=1 Tax=Neobacillus vireti TaxID=220686 RepID=UPI003000E6AE